MNFRIGKLRLQLSFPLVALMTAVIVFDTTMSVIVCFIAAIIHESGHLIALKHYHSFPKEIKLTLFDIAIIDSKKNIRNIAQELVVVLSGVAVNFLFAAVFYILFQLFKIEFLKTLYLSNLALGIFNILPVYSLDGGQAIFLILSSRFSIHFSSVFLDILSFIILVPVACMGFIILLRSKYNFTLLITAMYLMAIILLKNKKS